MAQLARKDLTPSSGKVFVTISLDETDLPGRLACQPLVFPKTHKALLCLFIAKQRSRLYADNFQSHPS